MPNQEEKTNYSNRRKTFHFSKKNDDLLQYLNKKDSKEQSTFIMRLIREEMEREEHGDPLKTLQHQLNQALEEIQMLHKELANRQIQTTTDSSMMDDEVINRLFFMFSELKRENKQHFEQLTQSLSAIKVVQATDGTSELTEQTMPHLIEEEDDFSDDEFDDLLDIMTIPLPNEED